MSPYAGLFLARSSVNELINYNTVSRSARLHLICQLFHFETFSTLKQGEEQETGNFSASDTAVSILQLSLVNC